MIAYNEWKEENLYITVVSLYHDSTILNLFVYHIALYFFGQEFQWLVSCDASVARATCLGVQVRAHGYTLLEASAVEGRKFVRN